MATAFVQGRSAAPSSDPQGLAFLSNVVAGNSLFGFSLMSAGSTPTLVGITDTVSSSYAVLLSILTPTYRMEVWRADAAASGANTVTFNWTGSPSGSSSGFLAIAEVSGLGTPTDEDHNTLDHNVQVTPSPCATLTATAAGIAFCLWRSDHSAFNFVGWTDSFVDFASGTRSRGAYKALAVGESLTPEVDCTEGEFGESLTIAIYEEVVGGGFDPATDNSWLVQTRMQALAHGRVLASGLIPSRRVG